MIELKKDNVAFFDVDDTLILYEWSADRDSEVIDISIEGSLMQARVVPHKYHTNQLKLHKTWGNGVVVWSRSGHDWAKTVVEKLNLTQYVDLVIAKPMYYYDDKPCCKILGEHRFAADN